MVRYVTPAEYNRIIRQEQQRRQQAINKHNAEVRAHNQRVQKEIERQNALIRQHNAKVTQNVAQYNRAVDQHNAKVRQNQNRLRSELARLQRQAASPRYVAVRTSTQVLHTAFERVEQSIRTGGLAEQGEELLDYAEAEAANSAAAANSLFEPMSGESELARLQDTSLGDELTSISADLDSRWKGALFALSPLNPDAARHFCTSARELLVMMVEREAPDAAVLSAVENCDLTRDGKPTRRAKVTFLLQRARLSNEALTDFVEADLDDALALFGTFNSATHGDSGKFDHVQLTTIKHRVEDAVRFLHRLIRPRQSA